MSSYLRKDDSIFDREVMEGDREYLMLGLAEEQCKRASGVDYEPIPLHAWAHLPGRKNLTWR